MNFRILSLFALVLSSFHAPALAKVLPSDFAHEIGSTFLRPTSEYPWQVGLRLSHSESRDDDDLDLYLVNAPGGGSYFRFDGNLTLPEVTIPLGNGMWTHNISDNANLLDDGDLDLYLVNAPGGSNLVRFRGILSAANIPEPSSLTLLLLAALAMPQGARITRNRN